MRRAIIGGLRLSMIDAGNEDASSAFNDIFISQIYHHSEMRLTDEPVVMDIGANIGLYTIWAERKYRPKAIYSYEASPTTFRRLEDNSRRLISGGRTEVHMMNLAISKHENARLVLHQSKRASMISTLLEQSRVSWAEDAILNQEFETHDVPTATISGEIKRRDIGAIDILKIDVEGYFIEALEGITAADYGKIANIVLEADYLPETGINLADIESLLQCNGYTTACLDRTRSNNYVVYAWHS